MKREEHEDKVTSLLNAMERIDAPVGFENRVMSRITEANASDDPHRPVILLFLKFAGPAVMLLFMGVAFVFFGDREVSTALVPPLEEVQTVPVTSDGPVPAQNSVAASSTIVPDPSVRTPVANTARHSEGSTASRPGVRSEDMAVQGPGETYAPPGLDPRPHNVDPSTVTANRGVKIADVLSFIGISTVCGDDGCRVTSLSKGSLADRARLIVGDRIISVDGRALNASTSFSGPTSFKTFQVVRGGRTLNLSLSSN